jgi:hypothetical protein
MFSALRPSVGDFGRAEPARGRSIGVDGSEFDWWETRGGRSPSVGPFGFCISAIFSFLLLHFCISTVVESVLPPFPKCLRTI